MRVVKACGDLYFLKEALFPKGGGQFGSEHFYRDLSVVLEVLGEVDGGHPARTDFSLDAVAGR